MSLTKRKSKKRTTTVEYFVISTATFFLSLFSRRSFDAIFSSPIDCWFHFMFEVSNMHTPSIEWPRKIVESENFSSTLLSFCSSISLFKWKINSGWLEGIKYISSNVRTRTDWCFPRVALGQLQHLSIAFQLSLKHKLFSYFFSLVLFPSIYTRSLFVQHVDFDTNIAFTFCIHL